MSAPRPARLALVVRLGVSAASLGFASASAGAPAVKLQAPTTPPREGDAMPFSIQEALDGPLFIDGCAALELELKSGGTWLTTPVKVCDTKVPATQFDGELAFSIPAPVSGTYRAILTWGTGCTPGYPLTTAMCTKMGSVTSDPVVVAPKTR